MRIGSLCSGYGGLDLAVEQHYGARVAWFAENDRHPATVYKRHWPSIPNHGDISRIDWARVAPVDIITAGYPCQPFSQAGTRKGSDDHRHLWPHIRDAIRVLRPRTVVLENVTGHLSLGADDVLGDLAALGFNAEWGVIRASDAGACHRRARWFCVATDPGSEAQRQRPGLRTSEPPHVGRGRPDYEGAQACPCCGGEWTWDQSCTDCGLSDLDIWQDTAEAVLRWESIMGRAAPLPVDRGPNYGVVLSPVFVEWLMGLPAGWVTATESREDIFGLTDDVPVTPHRAQLKMLGNGVIPQQVALALSILLPRLEQP